MRKLRLSKFTIPQTVCASILLILIIFLILFKIILGFGESMHPTIKSHTPIICSRYSKYDVGDIVYFKLDGKHVVHRIISKTTSGVITYYTTKGDGNESPDGFQIYKENIKCKVLFYT